MKDSENNNTENTNKNDTAQTKSSDRNIFHEAALCKVQFSEIENSGLTQEQIKKLVNQQDKDGKTPLHLAYQAGNIGIANMLIGFYHSDQTIKDNQGKKPIDYKHIKPKDRSNYTLEDINRDKEIALLTKEIKTKLSILDPNDRLGGEQLNDDVNKLVQKYTNYYSQSDKLYPKSDNKLNPAEHKKIIVNQIIKLINVENKFIDIIKGILNKISFNKIFREYKALEEVRKNVDMKVFKKLKSVNQDIKDRPTPGKPKLSKTERFKIFL